jgi:hypothetical protein
MLSSVHINAPEKFRDIQEHNIVIQFANFQIALETYMKLSDSVDMCFPVTVYWWEIYITLSTVYIDPLETFQDAILHFHLQIT